MEVLEYEVAASEDNLICLKLKTAYTEPLIGTKEIKHLVSLSLDPKSEVRSKGQCSSIHSGLTFIPKLPQKALVRYHKDQWNEKDYSHRGLGALMKKLNGRVFPSYYRQRCNTAY